MAWILARVLPAGYFGGVFMSNYLEHLATSDEVLRQLEVAHASLRPNGCLVVLQPNIRLVGGAYWDFIDHHVALTERSLVEAAELAGLRTVEVRTRFLPYSTRSRLPKHPAFNCAYLAFRPAWWLLGKQTLFVGERPARTRAVAVGAAGCSACWRSGSSRAASRLRSSSWQWTRPRRSP